MNKNRRKEIADLVAELSALKDRVETTAADEQDYADSMPDGIRDGERGQAAENAAMHLDMALDLIADVIESLEEAAA